ncbi:MetQ/NlpA family ABC transporter substrate-binding protein [Bacillus salipaludis]|uniref:MetQ/NlpA family ABC transporter substrate-binding protein n=1 Tax=Bacillus salipaludis TaxID=2547811 RepID=UPI002E21570F|nr:MetQ/NlpA family ABC transporter substrate-binding protein [Bacillus salipaludis]
MKEFYKRILLIFVISILALLAGCSGSETTNGNQKEKTIKIGVTGGPPEQITNIVKKLAKKEGINLEVTTFNDYLTPNKTLADGEIDLNMFQTIQFLNQYVKDRKDPIMAIGTTYNSTIGIYSKKYKSIKEIPNGATIGIPNDPVNIGRGLMVLEEAGLLKLNHGVKQLTVNDIEENPKQIKIKEMDALMILSTLKSIDAGVTTNTAAYNMGLNPKKDALHIETRRDYPMVVAARKEDKDNKDYKRIVKLYHSDEVKKYIQEKYDKVIILTDNPFTIK